MTDLESAMFNTICKVDFNISVKKLNKIEYIECRNTKRKSYPFTKTMCYDELRRYRKYFKKIRNYI